MLRGKIIYADSDFVPITPQLKQAYAFERKFTSMRENQEQKKVTSRQLSVISHLLASPSVEEACRRAKVSKPTVYSWMTNPAFKAELQRQREEIYRDSLEALKAGHRRAVERLRELVESPKDEIALRACSQVSGILLKLKELESREETPEAETPFTLENLREVWRRKQAEQNHQAPAKNGIA